MALQYCSQHHRLFVRTQHAWMDFPAELITRITELYQRVPLPEFAVIEAPCDRCEASCESLDKPDTSQ